MCINKVKKPTEWKKILANHASDEGLMSRIHEETLQLNKNSVKKGLRTWTDISLKIHKWPISTGKDTQHSQS